MSASLNGTAYLSSLLMNKATITPSRSTTASSHIKAICLYDWWLVRSKDESKRGLLTVAGIGSKDGQSRRAFNSAAISKRCDMVTLETADGILITLSGFINRSATQANGFSVEVCNCFQFGFPLNWKDYASFDEKDSNSSFESELWRLAMPMDDIPVSLIRDILLVPDRRGGGSSTQMEFVNNVVDDLIQKNVTQSEALKHKARMMKSCTGGGMVTRSMSKQNRTEKNASDDRLQTIVTQNEEASKVQNKDSRHKVSMKSMVTRSMSKQNRPEKNASDESISKQKRPEKKRRLLKSVMSDTNCSGNALNKDGVEQGVPSLRRSSRIKTSSIL